MPKQKECTSIKNETMNEFTMEGGENVIEYERERFNDFIELLELIRDTMPLTSNFSPP